MIKIADDVENMSSEEILNEINKIEQGQSPNYGFPRPIDKDTTLKLFRNLIESDDSKKVSYLDKIELIRTRGLLDIATYGEAEGLLKVSAYLETKAENIFATGMSKKGFFAQLIVTQIKKEQKIVPKTKEKKGWFSKKTEEPEEDVQ